MADNKETVIHLEDQGNVHISEDVVASIAALAASEVEGVSMTAVSGSGVVDLLGKKNLSRGIKITTEKSGTNVDVYILVAYGLAIPAVAKKVQTKVQAAMESMTGLQIGDINVHVNGVAFDKSAKK